MVPGTVEHEGRRLTYAVSDNTHAGVWAVNIHGYFASGAMYWRESARLAEVHGWRVVNPTLPGFGHSEPLEWEGLSLAALAEAVLAVCDAAGAGTLVVLGHSLGAAVAVQLASDHPERVRGLIYRDGAATPGWKTRSGPLVRVLGSVSPDLGAMADLLAAAAADLPDLAIGRFRSTARLILPDLRRNTRSIATTIPIAALLFTCDLRHELAGLAGDGLPMLGCWGLFDRLTPPSTARDFEELTGGPVVHTWGGHSWMLARPGSQGWLLSRSGAGRRFLAAALPPGPGLKRSGEASDE